MERFTSTVQFYCRESKSNKQGFAPIEMSLIIAGERVFVNTHYKYPPKDFKRKINERKNNELKEYLNEYRSKVNDAIYALNKADIAITPTAIKEVIVNGIGKKTKTINDVTEEFVHFVSQKNISLDQIIRYKQSMEYLSNSLGKNTNIENVTIAQLRTIYQTLVKENKNSTAGGKMARIKSLFKYAFDSGYIASNPAGQIRIRKERAKVEFLTGEEVEAIESKELICERLRMVRDLFLLQVYSGLSYADLQTITALDIKTTATGYYIEGYRKKTNVNYIAVLCPKFIEILKKYDGVPPKLSNQKLNAYLKEIGDLCGITKSMHSHLARKTYAHILIESGVPITAIARTLGHTTTRITEQIYAINDKNTIIEQANIW